MQAAIPDYLKNSFSDAAPGHRFGLYYAGWNDDFSKPKSGAAQILKTTVCTLPTHSRTLVQKLVDRQHTLASSLTHCFAWPAIATSPFATGLGNEHPLENGFAFLSPYGLPYLPGSGVKGVIRRAAEELASGEWGENKGWTQAAIDNLFGPGENDPERDKDPRQGALRFWDVFPTPETNVKNDKALLGVEIMTPHLGEYYQGAATPNTSLTPVPIPFLAVVAKCRFAFHVEANLGLMAPEFHAAWQSLLDAAFAHAGEWLGFGAKTAVGYGRMAVDTQAKEDAERLANKNAADARRTEEAAQKAAQLEQLSPFDRSIQEILAAKPADQTELKALFKALKDKRWEGEDAQKVAQRLQTMMQASKQWREKSEKKNPDKDEPYQMTLLIKSKL